MTTLIAKLKATLFIILLLVVISSGGNHSMSPIAIKASPTQPSSDDEHLVIDELNIEVKVNNKYVPLEELVSEAVSPEFKDPLPQILNNSILHINASYSTIIGRSASLAIHAFFVDVYSVISGEEDTFNTSAVLSAYYNPNDALINTIEFVLGPNSTKSEDTFVPLQLWSFGIYKFVFRVEYHIFGGNGENVTTQESHYFRNITFELVKSYPTPPYIIIYAFFGGIIILLVLIVFGLYGDRKYKQPVQ